MLTDSVTKAENSILDKKDYEIQGILERQATFEYIFQDTPSSQRRDLTRFSALDDDFQQQKLDKVALEFAENVLERKLGLNWQKNITRQFNAMQPIKMAEALADVLRTHNPEEIELTQKAFGRWKEPKEWNMLVGFLDPDKSIKQRKSYYEREFWHKANEFLKDSIIKPTGILTASTCVKAALLGIGPLVYSNASSLTLASIGFGIASSAALLFKCGETWKKINGIPKSLEDMEMNPESMPLGAHQKNETGNFHKLGEKSLEETATTIKSLSVQTRHRLLNQNVNVLREFVDAYQEEIKNNPCPIDRPYPSWRKEREKSALLETAKNPEFKAHNYLFLKVGLSIAGAGIIEHLEFEKVAEVVGKTAIELAKPVLDEFTTHRIEKRADQLADKNIVGKMISKIRHDSEDKNKSSHTHKV